MNKSVRTSYLLTLVLLLIAGAARAQVANFTASPTSGCAPLLVQFTSTSTGNINTYYWDLGNTTISTNQNPSTSYTTPGTYTVKLTVTGPSGTNTVTKTAFITVYPPPTISFAFTNATGCAPLSVPFTSTITPNAPGAVTYRWDFGDGTFSSSANPTHTYTSGAGSPYSVSLTVTNGQNCSQTVVQSSVITVYDKPVGSFSAYPTTNCQVPATVSFTNSVTGAGPFSVHWDFGDGGGTSGSNPTHTYTTTGTFTVKMYMTDSRGCSDSVVQPAYITVHTSAASFTGPTDICQSSIYVTPPNSPLDPPYWPTFYHAHGATLPARFNNTTPGATLTSTYWDYGDGYGDTASIGSHAYYTAGTYIVRMVTDVGGCLDTVTHVIIVHPYPTTDMSYSPNPNCPGPTTLQFTGIGAATYQWSWSKGGSSTLNNPTHYYTSNGIVDELTVIGTSSFGCKDTLVTTDTVWDIHIGYLGLIKGCAPFEMSVELLLESSTPFDGFYHKPIISYHWDFGDGSSSNAASPTHTYPVPGIYPRIVTITTSNGCVVKDTVLIHVGSKVHPSFIINPDTVCPHVPVYFTNTTPRAASPWMTYTWDLGQAYTPINYRDATTSYFRPYTYNVILYADSNGCVDSTICNNCVTVRPANANFADSLYCSPWNGTVLFIDSSVGATSHLWRFGDGFTSTATSPVHVYASTGIFNVTLITHNNVYGCTDSMTMPVSISPISINFIATDTTICKGDTLRLTPSYSGPAGRRRYEWYIDDQNLRQDSLFRPYTYLMESKTINAAGIDAPVTGFHNITFKVIRSSTTYGECIDTIRKNSYVIVSHPVANFGATPTLGCTPMVVTFRDSSVFTTGTSPGSRFWTFGDGDTTMNNNLSSSHTYLSNGVYSVKLKVTDWNGCSDSLTRSGYIRARHPKANFVSNIQNTCAGVPITFTNLSFGATPLSYKWSFGDGDTAVSLGPIHSYRAAGSYTVRLIVTDSTFCIDTFTAPAYIRITRPTAAFSLSDTLAICPPLVVTFNSAASVNAASYAWNFGNGGSSVITNPVSTFSAPGVYTVRLVATDSAGCTDTATAKVRVLGYSGALSYTTPNGCAPLVVQFLANITNVPSLVWDFSDGSTFPATGPTTSHTYTNPGSYVPKLIFSDGHGCSSSSTGTDTIHVDGVIAGFKVLPPCEKTPVQLIDTSYSYFSAVTSSRWDFGGAGIATGSPVQRTYLTAGTYPVTLISTNGHGCKDTISRNITIYPLPKVVANDDTAVCIPDAITLSATGAQTYVWSPGTALSCMACTRPVASPVVATTYVVIGTDSIGCAAKDTVRVNIQTKTTFVTNASAEICLGQHYQLLAAGATLYNWTPPTGLNDPNIPNPIATPTTNTTYIVTAREGSCLADTHSIRLIVRPLPVVDAGGDLRVVAGNGVLLQASGTGISRVAWEEDPSLSCFSCYAPEARPKVTTTYRLTAYNDYGCSATDSVRVYVVCDGSQLFIPNTFTPNGDGLNDFFFPRGAGIDHLNSFRVYSRWGELLFERTNMSVNDEYSGWNGTFNGRKLNPDVYVYVIEATCDTGEPIKFKGDITLLR